MLQCIPVSPVLVKETLPNACVCACIHVFVCVQEQEAVCDMCVCRCLCKCVLVRELAFYVCACVPLLLP